MSRLTIISITSLVSLVIIHGMLWVVNRDLHTQRMKRSLAIKKELDHSKFYLVSDLKTYRMKLEAESRKNLESFKWKDKGKGYVEIPINKAFDYYLRRKHGN